jgi:O-antigen ligase
VKEFVRGGFWVRVGFIKNNTSVLYIVIFSLLLGIFLSFLVNNLKNPLSIFLVIIFPVALYLLVNYPEISFALFLNAGLFKAHTALRLPEYLDLTVLLCIITIIGIIFGIATKRIKLFYLPTKLLLPYLGVTVLSVVSLNYTIAPIYGTYKLLIFLTFTSFAMFGPLFLFQKEKNIRKFFITYVLLAIMALFDVIFSGGLHMYKYGFTEVFGSSGYLGLGRFAGETFLILCYYFFFTIKKRSLKLFIIGLLIPIAFLTLVSGARGSLLGLGIAFLAILIYTNLDVAKGSLFSKKMRIENRKMLISFMIILCCFVFTIVCFNEHFTNLFDRTKQLLSNVNASVPVRLYQYHKALEVLTTFPSALTGLGIGGFSMFAHGYDVKKGAYVHNIFLGIGSELGIFGLLSFSLLIYWGFATAFGILKRTKDNQYFTVITLLSLFILMFIYVNVHGSINNSRSLLTWLGSIYAYRRLILLKEEKEENIKNIEGE